MKPSAKTAIAIFIFIAGVVGSYSIVKNSNFGQKFIEQNTGEKIKTEEKLAQNPIKWLKDSVSPSVLGASNGNFTENLGETIFEQIKSSDGIDLASGKTININDILKNKQLGLDFVSDISVAELKASQDNSIESKKLYLRTIGEINKDDFGDFKKMYLEIVVDVFQKLDVSSAKEIAGIYKNLADDYLSVSTPSDWLDFHKAVIIHFKNAATVYSAMADYLDDPLKGYLALEVIETIMSEGQQAQNLLDKHLKEIK